MSRGKRGYLAEVEVKRVVFKVMDEGSRIVDNGK
jgi:hypothetical protein